MYDAWFESVLMQVALWSALNAKEGVGGGLSGEGRAQVGSASGSRFDLLATL